MTKVALVRCESYEYEKVRDAVGRGLDFSGVSSGEADNYQGGTQETMTALYLTLTCNITLGPIETGAAILPSGIKD